MAINSTFRSFNVLYSRSVSNLIFSCSRFGPKKITKIIKCNDESWLVRSTLYKWYFFVSSKRFLWQFGTHKSKKLNLWFGSHRFNSPIPRRFVPKSVRKIVIAPKKETKVYFGTPERLWTHSHNYSSSTDSKSLHDLSQSRKQKTELLWKPSVVSFH